MKQFLSEIEEHIRNLEKTFSILEHNPSAELYTQMIKYAHSIKGLAGAINSEQMTELAHNLENLLIKLKEQKIKLEDCLNLILRTIDTLYNLLSGIQNNKEIDINDILEEYKNYTEDFVMEKWEIEEIGKSLGIANSLVKILDASDIKNISDAIEQGKSLFQIKTRKKLKANIGNIIKEHKSKNWIYLIASTLSEEEIKNLTGNNLIDIKTIHKGEQKKDIPLFEKKIDFLKIPSSLIDAIFADLTEIMVKVFRLEKKIKGIEEKEQFRQILSLINHLWSMVSETRLIPFEEIFFDLQRHVKELATIEEKKIELKMEGGDIKIDKTVLEKIFTSLLHLIRNAIYHGIEHPAERIKKGKAETGTILLKIFKKGNNTIIEVTDDGRGIDSTILNKIFEPGFSTAKKVDKVSGRGMGLFIVKQCIEGLRGKIEVESEKDKKTTFRIYLPKTIEVISSLIFSHEDFIFAIPVDKIERIIEFSENNVCKIKEDYFVNFKNENCPLIWLDTKLDFTKRINPGYIVIVRNEKEKIAIPIEKILFIDNVLVKPLPSLLKTKYISGLSLLSEGKIALMLNVDALN